MPPPKPKSTPKPAPKRDSSGWVKPVSFRLGPDVIADMDEAARLLTAARGVRHSRTDVVRLAVREMLARAAGKTP